MTTTSTRSPADLMPLETTALMGSPGSARSRIYARRLERQAAAEALTTSTSGALNSQPLYGHVRTASKVSPPHSADSQTSQRHQRHSRKTPPAKDRDATLAKLRQSPSHEIIKHFAPKDFSHLPPSPSSASINQFLRGSGSISNFTMGGAGSPPSDTLSPSTSYFAQTMSKTASLQRSDSHHSKLGKSGWEGREVDASTAEALRKLDGLGSTPGRKSLKSKMSTGASSLASRPGTPPPSKRRSADKRLTGGSSHGSLKENQHGKDSPLNAWVNVSAEEVAASMRGRTKDGATEATKGDKRESSSSTSFAGTPTSRESMPTSSTTPSSTSAVKGDKTRRISGGSDVSTFSDAPETSGKPRERVVPPVPPLPKGYISMRQGLSTAAQPAFVPLAGDPSSAAPAPPALPVTAERRPMEKKWSFSSALNLKLHSREPPSPSEAPSEEPVVSPQIYSTTPVAPAATLVKPSSAGLRLTPSSIPFFRRASSSSIQKVTEPVPETPKSALPPPNNRTMSNTSTNSTRKSMLGMHLPSMLRGSASKRGLSAQLLPAPQTAVPPQSLEPVEEKTDTKVSWTGRKRGKTLSISADSPSIPQLAPERHAVKTKPSVEGSLRSARGSVSSNRSESTVNGATLNRKSDLPSIIGSPSMKHVSSTSSLKQSSDAISLATRIPRIASRPIVSPAQPSVGGGGSMPPPVLPSTMTHSRSTTLQPVTARTMTATMSMAELGKGRVSEFGTLGNTSQPRQSTSISHRAHLLAPMSSRPEARRPVVRPSEPPRPEGVPPSKRHLPTLPSSATAMTISASAKRTSKDLRPTASRRSSKDTSSGVEEDQGTMKASKSLHSKLGVPRSARITSSSSVGAPGSATTFRSSALVGDSSSPSPFEDDEVLGDAEMKAYVKRRQARKAAGKKEDLTDVQGFPEDVPPAEPVSQRSYITKNLARMSDLERKEVLDFDYIYYSPPSRISRPSSANSVIYNSGYDDERGDYIVVEGDHLCYRYEVVGILGKGSFGQVVQCRDHKTGVSVAVKIIRNKKRFHQQALVEVKILQDLVQWDPEDKHFMVRMTDHFYFRGHLCIVTELLSINLYELIKANQFAGFSTVLIRRFTTQMLAGLQLMRSHRVVHCDLKPENILLCHPSKSGIKIIDFGSSCLETEKVYTYIQSRFYRSPEVILGMNYAMAIDMWSVGCIMAELYTGVPLFPGENEHEQLACIMEVLGVPERHIIEKASRRKIFFDATGAPRPFVNAKGKRRRPGTKTLFQVLKCDDELFVDFIAKCLTWDPDKRLKPQPAMRHPYILAGKRRALPSSRDDKRLSERSTPSTRLLHQMTSPGSSSNGKEKEKKAGQGLLISPPTPLMARHSGHNPHLTSSASKVAMSMSSGKLSTQALRNSTYMSSPKVSIG
ncbi:hypothetical protein TREMEDRAFT_41420 [Tremella mesenterica DSM 1558]|uniref:uncharacterized protein n=1 Tax=Tremella mesenterica (strain ATCC 24925 / CBS 8224 / DSM 1558 / NBRC 9311 / NRRL Y-6157 / RJB 2259-6 / UBC 559-6) TaxID=578456 RepID=UPI0003F49A15|nr:uncharacterized protein TREMEDRAFT_41420 [Tremella mesenterica DSM 1558]EIW71932.1 hypothetical protein TREMEDRAFT_41420 [Tremella mesenterica DSM 1558]